MAVLVTRLIANDVLLFRSVEWQLVSLKKLSPDITGMMSEFEQHFVMRIAQFGKMWGSGVSIIFHQDFLPFHWHRSFHF
jgi:hypothetical protein